MISAFLIKNLVNCICEFIRTCHCKFICRIHLKGCIERDISIDFDYSANKFAVTGANKFANTYWRRKDN
jgi:hypothetical protein